MRFFLEVSYNGLFFNGSQIQDDQPTVQKILNEALTTVFRTQIETFGASRTDAGVHANGNVYHFDGQELPDNLTYKLNSILPQHIAINNLRQVKDDTNARFDATSRHYQYFLHFAKNPFLYERSYFFPFHIDKEVLIQTAAIIKRHKNFETFSKRNTDVNNYNCNIFESSWTEIDNGMIYEVKANRFLRGMVRALVGTQLNCARGKFSVAEFEQRINARDCSLADFSVPGFGLYLEEIKYSKQVYL